MKNTIRKKEAFIVFLLILAICSLLTACSGPMGGIAGGGAEGKFSVTIGGGSGRSAVPWYGLIDTSELDHTVILSDGPGPDQVKEGVREGETVSFSVIPGFWTVTVEAYLDTELVAMGISSVNIESGPNAPIPVTMKKPEQFNFISPGLYAKLKPAANDTPINLSAYSGTIVDQAVAYVNANPNADYTLLLGEDVTFGTQQTLDGNWNKANLTIEGILKPRTITYNGSYGTPFTIQGYAGLTLGNNVTLKSSVSVDAYIYVSNYSSLTMYAGSKITGVSTSSLGVVYVAGDWAEFTMEDGEITGNTSIASSFDASGGVFLFNGGRFYMMGGSITGNTYNIGGTATPADVLLSYKGDNNASAEIEISGAAKIGALTLDAIMFDYGLFILSQSSFVYIGEGWTGSVAALNLQSSYSSPLTSAESLWKDLPVVKSYGGLTAADINRFKLGQFRDTLGGSISNNMTLTLDTDAAKLQ